MAAFNRSLVPTTNGACAWRWSTMWIALALTCFSSSAALPSRIPGPSQAGTASSSPPKSKVKKKSGKRIGQSRHHRAPIQTQPDAERTTEIQSVLARGGYYQGDPTGKWDADTIAALQKFQSANSLDAKGKLDAPTLQRLGLGSGIAGVSAPRPPAPPPPISHLSPTAPSGSNNLAPSSDASSSAASGTIGTSSVTSPVSGTSGPER